MQQQRKHDFSRPAQLRCHIHGHQDMDPGVNFRVIFFRLRHTEKTIDLRQDDIQCAATPQNPDENRRLRRGQRVRKFGPDPFWHQVFQFARRNHPAHQCDGGLVYLKA